MVLAGSGIGYKAPMRRQEKADRIGALLDSLYPAPPVPLQHDDPYTLLVAVVLSAQCTDERVNLVTPGLFAAADTPARMAALSEQEILQHIRSCGLAPGKAKNIRNLSRILVEKHGGRVPRDEAALEALPGVGHKTAGVVMVQAFGVPAFPVDTHIHRLAGRWGLSRARNVVETERDLQALFPRQAWSRAHLQIIYFGREHCPARGHVFERCPICSWAASKRRMRAELAAQRASAARRAASLAR